MEHTVLDQYVYEAAAKELYNLARNLTGSDEDALQMSSDAFVKAYESVMEDSSPIDLEQLKLLSIRLLYKCGKLIGINQNNFSVHKSQELLDSRTALFHKLEKLSYNQRFVILLFCCQKLKIEYISQILRRPQFLITRWLLSAAKKTELHDQIDLDEPESTGSTPNMVHPIT